MWPLGQSARQIVQSVVARWHDWRDDTYHPSRCTGRVVREHCHRRGHARAGACLFSPPGSAFVLSAVMSTIALAWNYLFNSLYERWEARQAIKGRSLARRIAHGVGFEGGLALILLPVMAYWLDVSLLEALVADLGLLVFFFFYTVALYLGV